MTGDSDHILANASRWVIKIGSAVLTDNGRALNHELIASIAAQVSELCDGGCEVILVSSGAVAAGLTRLGMKARPTRLHELQAAAAVGQSALVQAYEAAFTPAGRVCAQILLSHDDVRSRDRYLNARATIGALLERGVIPIVNENDTVVTDEVRFGDNDTLGALVANLIDADVFVMLTDQDGLYSADPRHNNDAAKIAVADAHDPALDTMVSAGSALGRGGMVSKLRAARLAARSGALAVIADGREPDIVRQLRRGDSVGTRLANDKAPEPARKQWLASLLYPKGSLTLDDGAVKSIQKGGRSLLSIGISAVSGEFARGDLVRCVDPEGLEVARGLVNYSADEALQLLGIESRQIETILGYGGDPEMIHCDNLVIT